MITDAAINLPLDDFYPLNEKEYRKLLKRIRRHGYYITVDTASTEWTDDFENSYCKIDYSQFQDLTALYKAGKEDIIISYVTEELVKKGFRFAADCEFHIDGSD